MSNIVKFTGTTRAPIPVDNVLEEAKGKLEDVLIIGAGKDGKYYYASSGSDVAEILWWIEDFKKQLLDGVFFE